MSGIQPTRDRPVMAAPSACTDDGVSIITGMQNESYALDGAWESTSVHPGPMSQENDGFVQGAYATMIADVGGS